MSIAVRLSTIAAAMRASNALLLDLLAEIAFGEDPLDRIILVTIAQANVLVLTTDLAQLRRYGAHDDVPPNEVAHPISISTVSGQTGIAFETVRLRIRYLNTIGTYEAGPEGVRITSHMVAR